MKKKYLFPALAAASMVVLASCGDDESSNAPVTKTKTIGSLEVSADDLAKCTSRAEGTLFVVDEEVQVCEGKKWNALACGDESVKASVKFEGDSVALILCDGDSVGAITSADVKDCEIAKGDEAVRLLCSGDTLATIEISKEEDESSSSKAKSSSSKAKSSASEDESSSSKAKSSASEDESSSSKAKSSASEDKSSSSKAKSSASEDNSSSSVKSSSSEAPASSAVVPTSSAAAPVSSSVVPASSNTTPVSSSSLERDEVWSFLDAYVEWRTADKGRVRTLEMDNVTDALKKNKFVECVNTSASVLFIKDVGKKGYLVFAATQKDGAKFFEFQVMIEATLPDKVMDQCKEPDLSSSSKVPMSSVVRPRSSSSMVRPRSSSEMEIILPSSSSRLDSMIIRPRSSSGMVIVLPSSSSRLDSMIVRASSSSRLDSLIVRPISSGIIVRP
ncbi:hypothetical protein [uncultured Fibrobacter sp.]|uniref:hypothetical protein n=1 Tax=uncultured Fibrobacter sp. TaxID=261512 RepID=UPI0025F98873|nr:hypothetical protein [uncultured Fibrobacter sp.]